VKRHPQKNSRTCVGILTGHPRTDRRRYVVRLLDQVDRYRSLNAVGHYDVHVYCDGDCDALQTEFQHVVFHRLTTITTTYRSSERSDGPLLQRLLRANETIKLSGVEFQRHRWLYVSQNYRRMLDDIFLSHPISVTPYQSCVIQPSSPPATPPRIPSSPVQSSPGGTDANSVSRLNYDTHRPVTDTLHHGIFRRQRPRRILRNILS